MSYACRSYDRQNHKDEKYDVPPVFLIGQMGVDVEHLISNVRQQDFW